MPFRRDGPLRVTSGPFHLSESREAEVERIGNAVNDRIRKILELDGAGLGGAVRHACWHGDNAKPVKYDAHPQFVGVETRDGKVVVLYRCTYTCHYCDYI